MAGSTARLPYRPVLSLDAQSGCKVAICRQSFDVNMLSVNDVFAFPTAEDRIKVNHQHSSIARTLSDSENVGTRASPRYAVLSYKICFGTRLSNGSLRGNCRSIFEMTNPHERPVERGRASRNTERRNGVTRNDRRAHRFIRNRQDQSRSLASGSHVHNVETTGAGP